MKNCLMLVTLLATACTIVNNEKIELQARENAKILATKLETSRNVLAAIEAYNKFFRGCFGINNRRGPNYFETGETENYGVYNVDKRCNKMVIQELSQPQVDLSCIYVHWGTEAEYKSDKCILQRRLFPVTNSGFFNYSRFLPQNSKVKTEENWLSLVELYNYKAYCAYLGNELTTDEKQTCQKNREQTIKSLISSTSKVKCIDAYKTLFHKAVRETLWNCAQLKSLGQPCDRSSMKEALETWGKGHLCTVEDWEKELD